MEDRTNFVRDRYTYLYKTQPPTHYTEDDLLQAVTNGEMFQSFDTYINNKLMLLNINKAMGGSTPKFKK